MPRRRALVRRLILTATLALAALTLSGCIRKMATITSDPPARLWVNGTYRGETPVEIPYNWNWYYDIKLEKPGYQTFVIRERFYAPPHHWVPFDFLVELLPVRSPEPQWRHYQLIPDEEALIDPALRENGTKARGEAQEGALGDRYGLHQEGHRH